MGVHLVRSPPAPWAPTALAGRVTKSSVGPRSLASIREVAFPWGRHVGVDESRKPGALKWGEGSGSPLLHAPHLLHSPPSPESTQVSASESLLWYTRPGFCFLSASRARTLPPAPESAVSPRGAVSRSGLFRGSALAGEKAPAVWGRACEGRGGWAPENCLPGSYPLHCSLWI